MNEVGESDYFFCMTVLLEARRIVFIRNTTRAISRKQGEAQAAKDHWQL